MSLQHILKNSSVSGKEPLASQLANGELSINYHADGPFLCCKDTAGNVRRVAGVWVSATAPSTPFPGELWLDTGISPSQLKVYKDSTDAWVFAGEVNTATTTTEGIVRLATNAEAQGGTSTTSAVTPAALQSKISDSTSTTSSTTIASSTAVKAVADTVGAALPKSGGTITGILEIGNAGQLRFEGSSADAYETTLAVEDPTATRTITLPDRTGTVITTGDTGTITGTMIADGTIVNADINASASIAHSKLAALNSAQVLLGNASNVPTATTVTGDVTISNAGVTSIASGVVVDADINASAAIAGTKISPDFGSQNLATTGDITIGDKIIHAGDTNTAVRFPANDAFSVETAGNERLRVDGSGRLLVGASSSFVNAPVEVAGNGAFGNFLDNNFASGIRLYKSRSGTDGIHGLVTNNTQLGDIRFLGSDGSSLLQAVSIRADVDGTPGLDAMPGRLVFFTTSSGSATPAERLRIDSSGTTTLTSATSTAPFIAKIGSSEVVRINDSSYFLFGTSFAYIGGGNITQRLQLHGTSASASSWQTTRWSDSAGSPVNALQKSRGSSVGNRAIVIAGDDLGVLSFSGDDGTDFVPGAFIKAAVNGTPGSNVMPGCLIFSTTPSGSATPTERLRITSDGVQAYNQSGPAAVNTTATLTVADLKNGIITSTTAAAVTMTLPTGTDTEAGFSDMYTGMTFEWSVINTGATNAVTVSGNTGHTLIGSGTVAASTSGRFASRRTGSNTFVTYRLS